MLDQLCILDLATPHITRTQRDYEQAKFFNPCEEEVTRIFARSERQYWDGLFSLIGFDDKNDLENQRFNSEKLNLNHPRAGLRSM